jgi:hypothetical protein
MKILRLVCLVSLFALCSMLTPFASAASGGNYYTCSTTCCSGTRASGGSDTLDQAYQNLSCDGFGGVCGPINCDSNLVD